MDIFPVALSEKLARVQSLETYDDIQQILNKAHKILGNPLLLHNMQYQTLFMTENIVTDDPFWNEYLEKGALSNELIAFCKNECFIDAVANAETITFLGSEKLPYDRLFGKINNKERITVANLILLACDRPLEVDDAVVFEALCSVVSGAVSRNEHYRDYGIAYQESVICKLIDGDIEDKELYAGHVANIDNECKEYIFIAVTDFSRCDPAHVKLVDFREQFRQMQPSFKYAIYQDRIVIIIGSDNLMLDTKKDLPRLSKFFDQRNIFVGIGGPFDNMFELPRYYAEAIQALNFVLKSRGSRRVAQYCEI